MGAMSGAFLAHPENINTKDNISKINIKIFFVFNLNPSLKALYNITKIYCIQKGYNINNNLNCVL